MSDARLASRSTGVFYPELDRDYPIIVRGRGVWVEDARGRRYLDAMSGGSMAATLGHGREDIVAAAHAQAKRITYVHNERLTNDAQETLADELVGIAPEGFTKVKFMTGGAEANETAIRLARSYHVERGEPSRWQIISPAQAYHGPTFETLALTGRSGLQTPLEPYLPNHLHIPPATHRFDPTGEAALDALDRALEEAGPENVAAFFMEPISAAALPAYTPPAQFWEGLAQRRERHGFLICFDEVVTGMGRTGHWFAANATPLVPDIIATAKGLGAGYTAIGAVLCRQAIYDAIASGSKRFTLGHTWDGAPLACAVGLAVIGVLRTERLVERVHERGPLLRQELSEALRGIHLVREVSGHGFLLGVEYVDPRDGHSFLPVELGVAGRIDAAAMDRQLVTLSTQPTRDGFAGDQSLFAPAFTASDDELAEMVRRFADSVREVAAEVDRQLRDRRGPPNEAPEKRGHPGANRQLRALVVEHEQATPGGLIIDWLQARSIDFDVLKIYEESRDVDPADYDFVVSLGSEFAAFDESVPWLGRERVLLTSATREDVPILGVCFGGQLLATVLGGTAFRAQTSEVGWFPVRTADPDVVTEGPWFQWHFDSFTPPPGARVIAESDAGPQAYVIGRNLGVQFHPEVTAEIMAAWVGTYRHELDDVGVDPDALLAETTRNVAFTEAASLRLLDAFLDSISGVHR